jgi:EmrB/QacA subfamily drug resistance transporter
MSGGSLVPASDPTLRLGTARGRWVLAATVLATAVVLLTSTVVNVALPAIGDGLDAGTAELQWVINGYLLTLASLILVGGSLGDRFGRKRMMVLGSGAFAVTSLLCGLAPGIGWLIAFRALQGVAAALLMPESLAIIQVSFRPEDRGRAIGAWSALGGIAAAVGPVLGGWLVDVASWRWMFYLAIPVAAAVIAVSLWKVPESRDPDAGPLDLPGAAAALVGLGGLSWALIQGPVLGWGAPLVWGAALLGSGALAGFLAIERRRRHPMMPPSMFANRQFAAANGVTFVVYAALGGVFFFLVVYLQSGLGYTALRAGLSLLPVTAFMLVLSPRAGDLAQRHGARKLLAAGPVLVASGMALMARIQPGDAYASVVLPGVAVFGLGLSATVAPVTAAVLDAADPRRTGVASGINNAVARTAQLVAVAVVPGIAGLTADEIHRVEPLAAGFPRAMWAMAALALCGAALAWFTIDDEPLGA